MDSEQFDEILIEQLLEPELLRGGPWQTILLIVLIVIALLFACGGVTIEQDLPEQTVYQWTEIGNPVSGVGLYRYIDKDARVACWALMNRRGDGGTGVSCLPLEQTALDIQREMGDGR